MSVGIFSARLAKGVGAENDAKLDCITVGPEYNALTRFHLSRTPVTRIQNPFPPNVDEITIKHCPNLTSIPAFPPTLRFLHIHDCPALTQLPEFPDNGNLIIVSIKNCGLTSLPTLHDGLMWFTCNNCPIGEVAVLPGTLEKLMLRNCGLHAIPDLPQILETLGLSGNPLTALPALPQTLRYLDINHTQISVLPRLPDGLHVVNVEHCRLERIPNIPFDVTFLWIRGNPWAAPYDRFMNQYLDDLAEEANLVAEDHGMRRQIVDTLRHSILAHQEEIAQRAEDILATHLAFAGGPVQHPGGAQSFIPPTGPANVIASFLSGQEGSLAQQLQGLRGQLGGRRTRRKGRKASQRNSRRR